ncbi:uncharacterized protein VNE69_02065 [Vairimorpha necatrix]|uniref:Uncharacterized protein n=1 Tax=Vairimorpha necatrix TaxID=6039 RepID=A0AAX4J9A4_9MICR
MKENHIKKPRKPSYAPDTIFYHERFRINKIIKKLNQKGNKIPLIKKFKEFFIESLLKDKIIKNKKNYKNFKNYEKYYKSYIKYIDETACYLIENYEDCEEDIEEINAEKMLDKFKFRSNGFFQYIKYSILDMDLSKPEDEIFNICLLEWYDMSEKERKMYRKLGSKKHKFYKGLPDDMRKAGHIIDNINDLDIEWDSQEEWID